MDFQHVDVFADTPFTGNSVTVFLSNGSLTAGQMLAITQEFRHFESIFLGPAVTETHWPARVFDLGEELDFAGHPVLGAAAVLHDILGAGTARTWTVQLPAKTVTVQTTRDGARFRATLDQGAPEYGRPVTGAAATPVLDRLGLCPADLVPGLAPAVVSTGLRYLVIPVSAPALARAAITATDLPTTWRRWVPSSPTCSARTARRDVTGPTTAARKISRRGAPPARPGRTWPGPAGPC